MSGVLETLWKMSWQSAALAGVAWLICRYARKAPASWRCALWVLVTIKLFVPPLAMLPSQMAVGQRLEPVARVTVAANVVEQPPAAVIPAGPMREEARETAPASPPPAEPVLAPSDAVMLLLLVGVLVMSVMLARKYGAQRRLVGGSARAGEQLACMLCRCARMLGVRRIPEVMLSGAIQTPMLVGAIRPVILLPEGIMDSCGEGDLRAMLLHELAHVRRFDMALLWLQQLAQVLFFFNPAVWLAGREMRRERELACDEMVLSRAGIAPKEYASGYVSALKLANARPAVATSLAMAEPFEVERARLDRIMRAVVPRLSVGWVVALVLAVAVGLPTFSGCAKPVAAKPDIRALAGLTPVTGPGLVVTLQDSPKPPKEARPDVISSCLVHDRDVRDVVNELWAAGAKAISVNGQRMVATSSIRCVGPVLLVNTTQIGTPVVIKAVGEPEAMKDGLTAGGGVAEGLGALGMITITRASRVQVRAYQGSKADAEVLAGVTAVKGAGVIVTLQDSPKRPSGAKPREILDYVVHDRDIRDVVNELWSSGATAISVNGERLVTGSAIQGRDGVVTINSAKLTQPFTINAIGDRPDTLENGLKVPGGIYDDLTAWDMIEINKDAHAVVPAYSGPRVSPK